MHVLQRRALAIRPILRVYTRRTTTEAVMDLRQRCSYIQRVLDHYYPNPPVPLDYKDTFTFLVAVVLSAQTTDGKVNEATKTLFKVAPTPQKLSKMTPGEVQQIIQSVGLAPRKSEYLVGLSRKIVEEFNGEVPRTLEELESLPGVGRKTASVILSQAFGTPAFPVDTHIHRLALRWGLSKDEKNATKVQEDLCKLFPVEAWHNLHLQMIYFGREYCTAKNHTPSECPICSWINRRVPPPDTFSSFSPKKQQKGIIYYHERIAEMTSPDFSSKIVDVKVEELVACPAEEPPIVLTKSKRQRKTESVEKTTTDDKPSSGRRRKKRRE